MTPKIYLAMDNCVLYKRWTEPEEWAKILRDMDVYNVEASADTELDPLYTGMEHMRRWTGEAKAAEAKYGVRVANLYSGHGSYTTLGMAHPEKSVRDQMIHEFFMPLIKIAGEMGCGMGFFAHAFPNRVLQSPDTYKQYANIVAESLCEINAYAGEVHCGKLGLEKMYTPHQYPWRNDDARELMKAVRKGSGRDFYITEDVGHHHPDFRRPTEAEALAHAKGTWLGTDKAYALAESGAGWAEISKEIEANPQVFMNDDEGGCYETLSQLGCYSPIIHIQQSDGRHSQHLPFTPEQNAKGIVTAEKVLRKLAESYQRPDEEGMPEKCDEIYLTLEIFSGTTSMMHDVLADCRTSVEYWRRYIPKDGMTLDELLARLPE